MKNCLSIFAGLLVLSLLQAQNLTSNLSGDNITKSLTSETQPIFPKLCSAFHFLPNTRPRSADITLIEKDSLNRHWFTEWMNSSCGISVFDGKGWSYYDSGNSPLFRNVYCVFTDKKGITWVGTPRGVVSFNKGVWTDYSQNFELNVTCIIEDKLGNIWCFTDLGVKIFNGTSWSTISIPGFNGGAWHATLDLEKNIWISTFNGVYRYNYIDWTHYTKDDGLIDNVGADIKLLGNELYYVTNLGINKFNGQTWTKFATPANYYGFNQILIDSDKKIWLFSNSFGMVFRLDGDSWTPIDLKIGGITYMYFDQDGTKWFTNRNYDVYYLREDKLTKVTNNSEEYINYVNTNAIYKDKRDNLWVSYSWNYSQGIGRYNGKMWTLYDDYRFSGIENFCEDSKNNFYAAGWLGIMKYDGVNWENLSDNWSQHYSYYDGFYIDSQDRMWFSDRSKIIMFDGNIFKAFSEKDGIKTLQVNKIKQDKNGNIWIVYQNSSYISKFSGSAWETIKLTGQNGFDLFCYDIESDSLGNTWFATSGGLMHLENGSIQIVNFSPLSYIMDMTIDKNNVLWLSSEFSDKIYAYSNNNFKSYTLFPVNGEFYPKSIFADKSGNIYSCSGWYGVAKFSFGMDLPEISIKDISCTGAQNGSLSIRCDKNANYSYSIDKGLTFKEDTVFTNLVAGSYKIISKSNLGCTSDTVTAIINQPAGKLEVNKNNISCNGSKDGSILINTEGLDNVDFTWSTGTKSNTLGSLEGGTYTVTITHGADCNFERTFTIEEPKAITTIETQGNVCGLKKGFIEIIAQGGTLPYTYTWSNGMTNSRITDLTAGFYTLSFEDKNHCKIPDKTFEIKAFPNPQNVNLIEKYKDYLCNGNVSINALPGYKIYQWMDASSKDLVNKSNILTVTDPGKYKLTALDANNCYVSDSIMISNKSELGIPQICMVTTDNQTGKNKIIWNSLKLDSAINTLIFKETNFTGSFQQIGTVPSYKSGIFMDDNSDSRIKSDRYYITMQDQCLTQSQMSGIHKTIHLSANRGTNGEVNLSWNHYEGFYYGSYNIYRGNSKSNLTFLTSVQSNINSFTDLNPPSGGLYYQLEIISLNNCNPDAFKTTYASVRSNVIDNGLTPILDVLTNDKLKVYPNPSSSDIYVEFDNFQKSGYIITLENLAGLKVWEGHLNELKTIIPRNDLPAGIYILTLKGVENQRVKVIFQ